jgi:hypothetical protein
METLCARQRPAALTGDSTVTQYFYRDREFFERDIHKIWDLLFRLFIHDYLDHHNAHPKPFVWAKSAEQILAKVSRARRTHETVAQRNQAINSVH